MAIFQSISALIEISRPKQWVKNGFVFAPLIFAQRVFEPFAVAETLLAVVLFCIFSSCVYMINDIADLERDRNHPKKSSRPLPSGRLSITTVVIVCTGLLIASMIAAALLDPAFLYIGLIYITINLLYSYAFRSTVILDGMFIAAGFVLRTIAGAVVIDETPSDWLYICALFVSLFLAYCKRRNEIVILDTNAANHREILREYSTELLDKIISIVTGATVVTYALYCIDETNPSYSPWMKLTIPFVIYGLFRYLYLVHKKDEGGNPTELLLTDRPLIINGFLWLIVVFWAVYFKQ